jgi:CheY-like chemotaxis protein
VSHESLQDKQALSTLEKVIEEPNDFVIPSLRILVVDDALTNRKLCMRLLDRAGHTTEGACDGSEAVEKVRKSLESGELYDCILLDYEMPVMRGPTACELMRKIGCSSFIAGVTGNVMSEDVDHFRNCGANWVLPKPFRLEALEQQLIEQGVVPCVKGDSERTETSTLLVDTAEDDDGDSTNLSHFTSRK